MQSWSWRVSKLGGSSWQFYQPLLSVLLLSAGVLGGLSFPEQIRYFILCGFALFYLTYLWLHCGATAFGFFKQYTLSISQESIYQIDESQLPTYTLLLPLFRESDGIKHLIKAIQKIDYPTNKLDVKLILQPDDLVTRRSLSRIHLPPSYKILESTGELQNQFQSCNFGLNQAQGEFVVVYTRDDHPEPLQLKKAYLAFRKSSTQLVALQTQLSYTNSTSSFLARFASLETENWYRLYLPGLYAIGVPLPLSNSAVHFKVDILKTLGGWDPFHASSGNELGIRLSRQRFNTAILASHTLTLAPSRLRDWLAQKALQSRGKLQSLCAHTQRPLQTARQLGWLQFLLLIFLTVGGLGVYIILPAACVQVIQGFLTRDWIRHEATHSNLALVFLTTLLVIFTAVQMASYSFWTLKTQSKYRLYRVLLTPAYLLLSSIATFLGFFYFFQKHSSTQLALHKQESLENDLKWSWQTTHEARQRWTNQQFFFGFGFLGALAGLYFFVSLDTYILVINILCILFFLSYTVVRIGSVFFGTLKYFTVNVSKSELQSVDEHTLPIYTILLPLYREPNTLESLLKAISELDYPHSKLDVKILLERNDPETRARLNELVLPSYIEIVDVPDGNPKTKPRACNHGLNAARGKFVVIFDAEDRPEPDQLKKAYIAFKRARPSLVCLQARLNCYNSTQNVLTGIFSLEYTTWFDLYLPGLYAVGAPIPLGGTSNHFKTDILKTIGGWDPYNVTEDCDLGIRIARRGFVTQILGSTTWEEAPSRLKEWFPQRTRWLKGYIQSFLVHTQNPGQTIRDLGFFRFILFLIVIGGQISTLILSPIMWTVMGFWFYYRWPTMDMTRPWTEVLFVSSVVMLLFNFLFIVTHFIGAYFRKLYQLSLWSVLFPFYWLLMSVATWRGLFQFFYDPFRWEKTTHGLAVEKETLKKKNHAKPISKRTQAVFLLAMTGVLAALLIPTVRFFESATPRLCYNNTARSSTTTQCTIPLDQENSHLARIDLKIKLPDPKLYLLKNWKVRFDLAVNDDESYHRTVIITPQAEPIVSLCLNVGHGWVSSNTLAPMDAWESRRIKEIKMTVDRPLAEFTDMDIVSLSFVNQSQTGPKTSRILYAPKQIEQDALFEAGFELSRFYSNPFDPDVIELWMKVKGPDQKVIQVPAFYTQDYRETLDTQSKESLEATQAAHWAARYITPVEGTYEWWIEGRDHEGEHYQTPPQKLTVVRSSKLSLNGIQIKDGYFHHRDNSFYYPIGVNLGWPVDERSIQFWDFTLPDANQPLKLMEKSIEMLGQSHVNVARVWMAPWWGGLEWNKTWSGFHGSGIYNLRNAWRMDQIFQVANKNSVRLDLVLDPHGPFAPSCDTMWDANPLNKKNGGFLNQGDELFTSERATRVLYKRYRYVVARYGAMPNLLNWSIFNEFTCISHDMPKVSKWTEKTIDYIKSIDFQNHLYSTGVILGKDPMSLSQLRIRNLDYLEISCYDDGDGLTQSFDQLLKTTQSFDKPFIFSEYGGSWGGGTTKFIAFEVHNGLWLGWVKSMSGASYAWWWNLLIKKNLARYHSWFSQFIENEDLRLDQWTFRRLPLLKDNRETGLAAMGRMGHHSAYLWVNSNEAMNLTEKGLFLRELTQGFDPIDGVDNLRIFDAVENSEFHFRGLDPGQYQVEFWDTWGKGKLYTQKVNHKGELFTLRLPKISRDIAIKIKPVAFK